ncbi:Pre-mRNA-processing factor 39 [Hordeum vulgare]|nr:Pre-mRNA-processing factor 39 [Hordeum vulgare]
MQARRESTSRRRRRRRQTYQTQMAEDLALSAASDCIISPSSPAKAEPGTLALQPEQYIEDGVMHEWVSAPPVWLGAMPEQEAAYLEHWCQWCLEEEGLEAHRLMQLERDAEAEEEECHDVAQPAPVQPTANDAATAWETAFPLPGPTLVDLTGSKNDIGRLGQRASSFLPYLNFLFNALWTCGTIADL